MINIRVPLDQFAFIDVPFEGTADEAIEEYKRVVGVFKGTPGDSGGLTAKEVDHILDDWFGGQGVNSDLYDKRNAEQDKWFQAIKRSLKRIKSHGNPEID